MAKKESTEKTKNKKEKKTKGKSKGLKYLGGMLLTKMAIGGAALLRSHAEEVNNLNVFPVPDGDTGDNMRMTVESGIAALENIDSDDLAEVMKVLSHGMLLGARGNSGVILSQFFAGTAKGFEGVDKADPVALGRALEMGVKQAYTSVMTPTEGTILTVAREAVEYAVSRITPESDIRTFFADLVKEMKASLERTPEILTVLKEADVVDSGGAGLLYIMDGFNRALNGEDVEEAEALPKAESGAPKATVSAPAFDVTSLGPDFEMTYGYCTEMLIQLQNSKTDPEFFDVDELKSFLSKIGDSVVAFKTDSIVKLHVHTLTPEKVLAYCREFGEFITVKIENMSLQHSAVVEEAKDLPAADLTLAENDDEAFSGEKKQYGVVAVCNGAGFKSIYKELGTDRIVEGGQTQNPSTNDFLDAFKKINAEHIFVLPNNGNIFMAAQQAAELYEEAKVHVIPSKNVGAGYVSLASADLSNPDADLVEKSFISALENVAAGYVSPSIRDADINGVHVNNGDTIGIIGKEIVVSEKEKLVAAVKLAEHLMADTDKFMLSVFCGKDTTIEENDLLQTRIEDACPGAEVYFIDGGQDIYPYIFVAE